VHTFINKAGQQKRMIDSVDELTTMFEDLVGDFDAFNLDAREK